MSQSELIVRVAAKGDGVTASGRHVAGAAPGDTVLVDGSLLPGPHHANPPCRHYGACGGCQLQHLDEDALATFVNDRALFAARGQRLEPDRLAPVHLSPPRSRRRATLHAQRAGNGKPTVIGFREAGSHRIVDMTECHVLRPELFALVAPLRELLGRQQGRWAADIHMTLIDEGVDMTVSGLPAGGLALAEALQSFAQANTLARLSVDYGYGPETVFEPRPATITLSGVPVSFPSGAFLQATEDGEAALTAAAIGWLEGAYPAADLFSGLGTFAFALAGKVDAYEASRDAARASRAAGVAAARPVGVHHRDLFRDPLSPDELGKFRGVILDPPRAGAREQIARIAQSTLERVIYVSCNPASWAKDARTLAYAGFRLAELRPVGQFRWSTHVELASLFTR